MAEEADKSERTEPPSPFKLREAKKKGQVSKSTEVNTAAAVVAGLLLVLALGSLFVNRVLALSAGLFGQAGKVSLTPEGLTLFFSFWIGEAMIVLSPVVAVLFLVGVTATILQTGFVFSTFPLKPDLKRLNPVAGLKKLLDIKILYEVVRSVIKLLAFSAVTVWTVMEYIEVIQQAWSRPSWALVLFFLDVAAVLLFRLAIVLIVFAVIDVLFTRWQFMGKMRMSHKEIKDEIKRREGDPQIRAKRRELEREMRKRSQSVSSVPGADLIVTNPTHYAIVIQYDRQRMAAPCVVGKGAGEMARVIRQEALRYRIPVICSPALARALYRKTKIDQVIGREFFVDVARLLRQVYRERSKMPEVV